MKWLGYKKVKLSSVSIGGEVQARKKEPRVVTLAKDLRELGDGGNEPINAPTVRNSPRELVAGRDRWAALMLNGAKETWVHLADCTDQEAADLRDSEDLYRRDVNRSELLARRVRVVASQIAEERKMAQRAISATVSQKLGRPKSELGEARERVAAEARVSPATVRKAEEREKAKAVSPGPEKHWADDLDTPIFKEVLSALRVLGDVDKLLVQAQRHLSGPFQVTAIGADIHRRAHHKVHELAATLRSLTPVAICPYCKGTPEKAPTCKGCSGLCVVTEAVLANAPKNGAHKPPTKPPVQGKKLAIQLPDGAAFDDDEGDAEGIPF